MTSLFTEQQFIYFLSIFDAVMCSLILFYFLKNMNGSLQVKRRYQVLAYASLVLLTFFSLNHPILNTLSMVVYYPFLGFLLYKQNRKQVAVDIIYSISLVPFTWLSIFLFQLFFAYFPALSPQDPYVANFLMVVNKWFVFFIATTIIILLFRRNKDKTPLSIFQFLSILLLSVGSYIIFAASTVMYGTYSFLSEDAPYLYLLILLLVIFMNLYFIYYAQTISKNNQLSKEVSLYRQQSRMQMEYYKQLEEKYQGSRKIIHDIRNHLNSIASLYESGKAQEAARYIEDIHGLLNRMGQKFYTSHEMLNIILNDKLGYAQHLGIRTEAVICQAQLNQFRDIDLTSIFSNLLDNSIAAASQCKEDPYITVAIDQIHDFLIAIIKNSVPLPDQNSGYTPGTGLKSVAETLKAYNGTMDIQKENGTFQVTLSVPVTSPDAAWQHTQ